MNREDATEYIINKFCPSHYKLADPSDDECYGRDTCKECWEIAFKNKEKENGEAMLIKKSLVRITANKIGEDKFFFTIVDILADSLREAVYLFDENYPPSSYIIVKAEVTNSDVKVPNYK